ARATTRLQRAFRLPSKSLRPRTNRSSLPAPAAPRTCREATVGPRDECRSPAATSPSRPATRSRVPLPPHRVVGSGPLRSLRSRLGWRDVFERVGARGGPLHGVHDLGLHHRVAVPVEKPEFLAAAAAAAVVPENGHDVAVDGGLGDVLHVVALIV